MMTTQGYALAPQAQDAAGRPLARGRRSISLVRQAGLGAGNFSMGIYWQVTSVFLLYFYTDVLGLSAATAGLIYMAALVWDGLIDPVVGLVADRTRSRFGRYRPYLMFGAPALAGAYVLMFVGPAHPGGLTLLIAGATHFVFRTAYAIIAIPYQSLSARVTTDTRVRTEFSGVKMFLATGSAVGASAFTLPLVARFGAHDPRAGWIITAALYTVICTAGLWVCAAAAKGLDRPDASPRPHFDIGALTRTLLANGPFWTVFFIFVCWAFSQVFFQKTMVYYFKYVTHRPGDASIGLSLVAAGAALSIPVWSLVCRRIGKRPTWLLGSVFGVAGMLMWRLADGHGSMALFTAITVEAVGGGAVVTCIYAMIPDTVEYGQWRTGLRAESMVFGLIILAQKASLGLGAGCLGAALGWIGYRPNVPQHAQTLQGLKDLMFYIPLGGILVCAALAATYSLSEERHRRLTADLLATSPSLTAGTLPD
jgi:GPH family glycoside/pentoside/hexuronide:cation symporter